MTVLSAPWHTEPVDGLGPDAVQLFWGDRYVATFHGSGWSGWWGDNRWYATREEAIASVVAYWLPRIEDNLAARRDPFYIPPQIITRQNWEARK